MQLKTSAGAVVDVDPGEILRAAGVIYSARRKTCAGPTRTFRCRWCKVEVRGRVVLDAHQRDCDRRPSGDLTGVSAEDMAQWSWTPPRDP